MTRLVIVIATAIVIVIAGLIIWFNYFDQPVADDDDDNDDNDNDNDDNIEPPLPPDDDDNVAVPPRPEPGAETVSVSINAIPWARVFIKLPQTDYFMEPRAQDFTIQPEPNQKNFNVTPIPGSLKVPIGTTIKLRYHSDEKIVPYEEWKDRKTISHDFTNQ